MLVYLTICGEYNSRLAQYSLPITRSFELGVLYSMSNFTQFIRRIRSISLETHWFAYEFRTM